ncbi:MAG: hypothetical protein KGR26_05990 [Cyanobacteria bacterium REEB65]|nr:hypothetical protein [Cyanobacteria bacterium REEB65]
MACSEIDWASPVEFEDGRPAHLKSTLSASGKNKYAHGASDYADLWAELYEAGVRYFVTDDHEGGQAWPFDEYGRPKEVWMEGGKAPVSSCCIVNVPFKAPPEMEQLEAWGMFG